MSDDNKWILAMLVATTGVVVGCGIVIMVKNKEIDIAKTKCQEAGGIYTPQYGVPAICFSPDAIRGKVK